MNEFIFRLLICFGHNLESLAREGEEKTVQMSAEKVGKRCLTVGDWTVSDAQNVYNSNKSETKKPKSDAEAVCKKSVAEQTNKPVAKKAARVDTRRRSLRLSNKTFQRDNNENTSKNSPAVRLTTTTTSDTFTATALQANPSSEANTSTAHNKNKVFKVRTRCDLSESISSCFNDKIQDPLNPKRYSAKCILCDINEPRKFFWIGNNSNLKSHISRVITIIKIDQF